MTRSSRPAPTPDAITAAIGGRLADLRRTAGIRSQEELARRMTARGANWSRISVEKLENGRRGAITAQELVALADVFGVSPISLLDTGNGAAQTLSPSAVLSGVIAELQSLRQNLRED